MDQDDNWEKTIGSHFMRILITGGAGFIGCNVVQALLNNEKVSLVRVFDNLSTGSLSNLTSFENNPK